MLAFKRSEEVSITTGADAQKDVAGGGPNKFSSTTTGIVTDGAAVSFFGIAKQPVECMPQFIGLIADQVYHELSGSRPVEVV